MSSQFEPSTLSGIKNEIVGAVKENLGWALGNKELEHEGKITREQGHMELEAARAERKATGGSSSSSSDFSRSDMGSVFADIRGRRWNLKKTKTNDKSCPCIDKNFKLRKAVDRKPMFAEIRKGGWKLRHVDTMEKKSLHLDQGFKLRTSGRKAYLADIRKGGWNLKKTKTNDRSAPHFDRIEKVKLPAPLLKEIKGNKGSSLHHVSTVDKSGPMFDKKEFKLHKLDRKPFLGEVKKGVQLKHVETCDKSGLNLPRGFHLTTPIAGGKTMSKKSADKGKSKKDMQKGTGSRKATKSH